jgi:hypothetical protein
MATKKRLTAKTVASLAAIEPMRMTTNASPRRLAGDDTLFFKRRA